MNHIFLPKYGKLHPAQRRLLESVIVQGKLAHAYLFYGSEGIGKDAFALELAAHLLCEKGPLYQCGECPSCKQMAKLWHPDLHLIFPSGAKSASSLDQLAEMIEKKAQNPFLRPGVGKTSYIGIDIIRELRAALYEQPLQSDKKIVIIFDADAMRTEAANALLKILEEPPPYVCFFLVSSKISRILPTILSRCQSLHFDKPEIGLVVGIVRHYFPHWTEKDIIDLVKFTKGNLKKMFDYSDIDFLQWREKMEHLLTAVLQRNRESFSLLFYRWISEGDKSSFSLLLEWFALVLVDLVHVKNENPSNLFIPAFASLYQKAASLFDEPMELIRLADELEEILKLLHDEHNFNEQLLVQTAFEKLTGLFFQTTSVEE